MTTKADIKRWFKRGEEQRATHMIVVCDTFDHEDYPVFVSEEEDVHEVESKYSGKNMQRVMEVYNLNTPIEEQIHLDRAFVY